MSNLLSDRKPIFTEKQFERLSNIADSAGQVVFGIAVVSPMISGFDRINLFVVISSVVLTFVFWALSVWLARKG